MIIDTLLSSNEHIVRTTQQWESTVVKYKIIPNGCLCVEFTPDGKTKIKVGDGHKYYSQLPYIGGDIDIQEIIELIEEYVDSKEFMEIQEPVVPSADELPSTGNDVGDVRFVINDNPTGEHDLYIPYVWFNDKWNIVGGGNVDLSDYPTKEEMNEAIDVVDDKVNELSETVNTFDSRITDAENKVSELDEKVTEIGDTVETFDDRITNVENKAHTHNNKNILDNTTASFTIQEETKLAGIEDHANNYSLPKASNSTLGGIKVGNNLEITSDGTLNATGGGSYTLPPATTTDLGGIIVGNNLSITPQGVLSATGGGSPYVLPPATTTDLGGVIVGNNINVDTNGVISTHAPYSLPQATDSVLGGIKVGNNLTIDSATGVLSADASPITIDNALDDTSENPVQNKVLTPILEDLNTQIIPITKQKIDTWWNSIN